MNRKIAASMSLCGLLFSGAGCMSADQAHNFYPHAGSETLTQSGKDHRQAVLRISQQDKKSLIEDLDAFFLTERPSRLNRWHSK